MEVRIVYFEECPNVGLAEARVREAAADHPDINIIRERVADPAEAIRAGMHGSPTILVDGVDPFAEPGAETSWACRVFDSGAGFAGAPSAQHLRDVMRLEPT